MQAIHTQHEMQIKEVQPLLKAYVNADEGSSLEKESKEALRTYLHAQSMAFIKFIQVVIHIGKTNEAQSERPLALYDQTMEKFDQFKGWRPKEIEIQNMLFKAPLDTYFEKGLHVLGK